MQRWFFANESNICKERSASPSLHSTVEVKVSEPCIQTLWTFSVKYNGKLCSNELLAVTGNVDALGKWEVKHCKAMTKHPDSNWWNYTVNLPRKIDIKYRYVIIAKDEQNHIIIRFWETHEFSRVIPAETKHSEVFQSQDEFGVIKDVYRVQRGWIMPDMVIVHFKFFYNPFMLQRRIRSLPIYVKITPTISIPPEDCPISNDPLKSTETTVDDKLAKHLKSTFAFVEVASMNNNESSFHYQPQFGTSCGDNEYLIFNVTLGDMKNIGYLVDLFNYPKKAAPDMLPYHLGYLHIKPHQILGSQGILKLPIICATTHRPIGAVKFGYIVFRPFDFDISFTLEKTLQNIWNKDGVSLDIAHRGCGPSFWMGDDILRENTLRSLSTALSHGADVIEFDIQLTKDYVPICFHDLDLCISRSENIDPQEYDIFRIGLYRDEIKELMSHGKQLSGGLTRIPIREFTYEQLKRVKVYDPSRSQYKKTSICTANNRMNLPFVSLRKILKFLPPTKCLNIDVKWPLQLQNERILGEQDMNTFVDNILKVVYKATPLRPIIFSSFSADICAMFRLKQNYYPVAFLANGQNANEKFVDPRGLSLFTSAYYARAMELEGVGTVANELLANSGVVALLHKSGKRLFSWGIDNRLEKTRKLLRNLHVDGITFDRINHAVQPPDLKSHRVIIDLKVERRQKSDSLKKKCVDIETPYCLKEL